MSPLPTPGCPDDRRKAADVRAELDATVVRATQAFMRQLGQARERLSHVTSRQRLWERRAGELAPLADDPRGAFHAQNARILGRLYGALRRQLEIEAAAHQANLAVAGSDGMPDPQALRAPDDDPNHAQARRQADYFLGIFLWRADGEGVDAALRATGRPGAIAPLDADEATLLATRAEALRAAAEADPALGEHLAGLAAALAETAQLLDWAGSALKRREATGEAEWGRLAAKLAVLRTLHAGARPWPVLAALFQEPDSAALPFGEPEAARP